MHIQLRIGLIGDFYKEKLSQAKIDQCLDDIANNFDIGISRQWISTASITSESVRDFGAFNGLWAGPGDLLNPFICNFIKSCMKLYTSSRSSGLAEALR